MPADGGTPSVGRGDPSHEGDELTDAPAEVGKSDDFAEAEAMDDLVYHYLDVMDALGLERPHVVGASFGGWLAT